MKVFSRRTAVAAAAAAIVALPGCREASGPADSPSGSGDHGAAAPGPPAAPWFEEVAASAGLGFVQDSGHREGVYLMPETVCGGGALLDMDGDGDLDAYLVQSGRIGAQPAAQPPNRLYRNRGDGTFEDVTEGSGTDHRGYGMGVATGDYDNDGDVDLYVTNLGPNVLLANDGTGRFRDVTALAGVGHPGWGASCAFLDYDADGWLDLFVCNYLNWTERSEIECYNEMGARDYCGPTNYRAPAMDVLYRNRGDGTFEDVTRRSGVDSAFGTGLGVICGDFDGDGRVDIFVADDGMPDQLWINAGDGTFRDEAVFAGCAVNGEGVATSSMGVTAADIDDDGDLDLLVCNLDRESDSLFLNEGGYFAHRSAQLGLGAASRPFTRFGMAWADLDNDGLLDLYQANGRVMRKSTVFGADPYAEPNLLFCGRGGGRYDEVRPRGGTATLLVATSRAAAFGDVDGDGGIDVLVVNRDGPAHLLRNTVPGRGRWISFRVLEEHGRDAYGATVTLRTGGRRVGRDVRSAYSYMAANDPRVHVGLGAERDARDVAVRWPDGAVEQFGSFEAGRVVTLRRGEGRAAAAP
jgi:hypothetical protein